MPENRHAEERVCKKSESHTDNKIL